MIPLLPLALLANTARAAVLQVPADHLTLTDALDAAGAGDTILVAAGEYEEQLVITTDVDIVGVDGAGSTRLWHAGTVVSTSGADLTLLGFTVESTSGRALEVVGGVVALTELVVSGHEVNGDGAGLRVRGGAEVVLQDVVLSDNDAGIGDGGHVAVVGASNLIAIGCDFVDGTAASAGAVYASGSTVEVRQSAFSSNSATSGGAVFAEYSDLTLEDCTFELNSATGPGGDVLVLDGTLLALDGTSHSSPSATHGGGVYASDSTVTSTAVDIDGAVATGDGGGLYLVGSSTLDAVDGTWSDNLAGGDGGALWSSGGGLTLDGLVLHRNKAVSGGGLAFEPVSAADLVLSDLSLMGNEAEQRGGALLVVGATDLSVSQTLLCANLAQDGAGAWIQGVTGAHRWANDVFVENEATGDGGALYLEDCTVEVVNDDFLANTAGGEGGAVRARDTDLDFRNDLVAWTGAGDGLVATWSGTPAWTLSHDAWWSNTDDHLAGDLTLADLDGTHLFVDPTLSGFVADGDCASDTFWPAPPSSLFDAGDPTLTDPDGSTSDIGVSGGPGADPALFVDGDEDDWVWVRDCDDTEADVNPDAEEVCDAADVDEDCDGLADDDDPGVTDDLAWYPDTDVDLFGDADATPVRSCDPVAGSVSNDRDCDDGDADINPDATEVCDAADVDEDCDRFADDADGSVVGRTLWYLDDDGDDFGDLSDTGALWCDPPAGLVADHRDCDDGRADVNPEGTEVCDVDDADEDCDGLADDADADVAGRVVHHVDADGDGYGDQDDPGTPWCDPPSGWEVDATDCDDDDEDVNPGEDEVCDADDVDEDCDGLADDADPGVIGTTTWYPDVDQDTFGDADDAGTLWCDPPSTVVDDATDCDDSLGSVYPGADEVPDDGVDQDCAQGDLVTSYGGGGGCATPGPPPPWWVLAAAFLARRRRR